MDKSFNLKITFKTGKEKILMTDEEIINAIQDILQEECGVDVIVEQI